MPWTLVTGSAKGLGAAICLELAAKGFPVVIQYRRSQKEAFEIAKKCREFNVEAEVIQADFSTQESTKAFIDEYLSRFPQTVNLVNNIGDFIISSPLHSSISDWRDLFQTNLFAPIQLMQALIPSIIDFKGGIINIGVAGIQNVIADTYATAYTETKLSLLMMTRSLAKELLPMGVRLNMVSPGFMENAVDLPKDFSKLPFQRPASLAEVARVVSFLLDPKNSYITGQNIEVDGGLGL